MRCELYYGTRFNDVTIDECWIQHRHRNECHSNHKGAVYGSEYAYGTPEMDVHCLAFVLAIDTFLYSPYWKKMLSCVWSIFGMCCCWMLVNIFFRCWVCQGLRCISIVLVYQCIYMTSFFLLILLFVYIMSLCLCLNIF